MQLLLEGQVPPEGEAYGPWAPQMTLLRQTREDFGQGSLRQQLVVMLKEEIPQAKVLLKGATTPDGQPWEEALEEEEHREEEEARWAAQQARWAAEEERRAAAEREAAFARTQWALKRAVNEIAQVLEDGQEHSRTELYEHFSRNMTAERLDYALFTLHRQGRVLVKRVPAGGRPREVWYLPRDEEA